VKKIIGAAVASIFAVAACGGASAPAATSQATTAAAPTTAAQATAAPAATTAKTQTPATAAPAASAAAASAPAANTAVRKIALSATNSLYSISTLEVKPGEKIEFVLTNTGDEKHNLVGIGEGISLVSPDFDSGSTVTWDWTAPTKLGTFKLQCSYHTQIPPIVVTVK
jgi:plastocyanin